MNARLITDNTQDEAILAHALRLTGIKVTINHTVRDALMSWPEVPGDLIVTAVRTSAPVTLVREIREAVIVPLIVIVDGIDEDTHVDLVNAGADWVIERPYNVRLLIAYAKAMFRRGGGAPRDTLPSLHYDEVQLNPANRTVRVSGRSPQRLSQLEFRLLHTLMLHQGQVLPTETIVEHVWGYTGDGDRSLVRGLINRLRMKIEPNPNNPLYIRTVPRVGYIFGDDNG